MICTFWAAVKVATHELEDSVRLFVKPIDKIVSNFIFLPIRIVLDDSITVGMTLPFQP